MANEWKSLPIADAPVDIIDGDRGTNYPKLTDFSSSGHCLFLNTGNVTTSGFNFSERSFVSAEKDAELRKGKLQRHDVVMTTRGTVGNAALFDESVPFEHVRINSGMVLLRADETKLLPSFLYQFVRSRSFKNQVAALTTGSAQPQLPIRDIRRVQIPIPPLPEQKAIAGILGTLDDKIELNRRMNTTLEAIARALFQSWFVDFDPVHAKAAGRPPSGMDAATAALFPAGFQDSALGEIPDGWTHGTLGDVATNPRRSVQPSEIEENTPYIALEHMPRRSIALGGWESSAEVESAKTAFQKGEILFGKLRPYFHKVGVAPVSGVCSTDILVLAPSKPDWFGFLLGHVSSDSAVQFADKHSTGTKMPRTNWTDLSSFKFALPPTLIAKAFNDQIQPMIGLMHANLHQTRTLSALRDTLLPGLLSGQLATSKLD